MPSQWDGAGHPAARTTAPDSSGDPQDIDRGRLVQPFRDLGHFAEGLAAQKTQTALVEALIVGGFLVKKAGGALFGVFTSPEAAGGGEEAELWRQAEARKALRGEAAGRLAAALTAGRLALLAQTSVVTVKVQDADP